jgi:hypothetical protein
VVSGNAIFFLNPPLSWTQESPQHKEQVSNRGFFPNLNIFLPILDELKNLGFGGMKRNP